VRPWIPEEVPVGGVMATKDETVGVIVLGVYGNSSAINQIALAGSEPITRDFALENYKWRWAHEKDWKPCGVEE